VDVGITGGGFPSYATGGVRGHVMFEHQGPVAPRRRPIRHTAVLALVVAITLVAQATAVLAVPSKSPTNTDQPNGPVYAIAQVGGTIYIGGRFTRVGGQTRNHIAALNASTGKVTSWNPGANGPVYGIEPGPNGSLFIGGKFGNVRGVKRANLAQLSAAGTVLGWSPSAAGRVDALAWRGDRVYVGGRFTALNGARRDRIGAVTASTGQTLSWNPGADGWIWDIDIAGDGTVWVGGKFIVIGGQKRRGVAALSPTTGQAGRFSQKVKVYAYDIVLAHGNVYVAGGGGGGQVLSYTMGGALRWHKKADGDLQAIDASSTTIYAGGHQAKVDGLNRKFLVAVDAASGRILDWNPGMSGGKGPYEIVVSPSGLLVGGVFERVNGSVRTGFARFSGPL
jgi:trimeric autotransporter adhesin